MILNTPPAEIPRMLIFFRNLDRLADAYQYVTVYTNQLYGELEPVNAMFHLITDPVIKENIISDLNDRNGRLKVVFCSSSLSMGMNLAAIEYVIHYGPPTSTDSFIQELGRASREPELHAHSILLTYPRMASGRVIDGTMKKYVQAQSCLRQVLLSRFNCIKPADQQKCCDVCEPQIDCIVKNSIINSYESSLTESFSSADSIASCGQLDDL